MRPVPTCPACRSDFPEGSRFCPSCGAAALATGVEPADPWLGRVVNGKFRVDSLLGQGGMGRVYKATHLTLDRPVVLKMLHRGLTSDPSVAGRFRREAKAASRLVNPHSIQVLDFGEAEDGTLFMAMEYLPGRDLGAILAKEGALPEERIVRLGGQILEALGEAHARGIIHRDLKPENVMVEDRRNDPDHVTVLDFGIAKISDPGPGEGTLTQAGLVCGTPQYMSPEQARGLELDPRSDLYAMGIILYQMATGMLPFESDTPVGYLTKHIAEPPAPMRERYPGLAISPRLEALVGRALSKDPAGRPATADAMRAELLACGGTVTAAPAQPVAAAPSQAALRPAAAALPAPPPAAVAPRKGSRLAGPIVLAVVLLGAGVGVWAVLRKPAETLAPGVPSPTSTATPTVTPPPTPTATPTATATSVPTPAPEPEQRLPSPPPEERARAGAEQGGGEGAAPARGARRDAARARVLYRKAEARRRNLETRAAVALYLRAAEADPGLADVHKKLGQCYQLLGDIPRAREHYRKYLATAPPDADRIRASLEMLR
jgi:serine/threonine-protein kinase